MVIPINAVPCGFGFDAAGQWHEAEASYQPDQDRPADVEVMRPARGAAWGLLVSGVLWAGLAAVAKGVLLLMR